MEVREDAKKKENKRRSSFSRAKEQENLREKNEWELKVCEEEGVCFAEKHSNVAKELKIRWVD